MRGKNHIVCDFPSNVSAMWNVNIHFILLWLMRSCVLKKFDVGKLCA